MYQITDLNIYYLRLLNLIESDLDIMMSEPDMAKRNPKVILEYLKMAKQCQEELKVPAENLNEEWNSLNDYTKDAITKLIEEDVNARK